MAQWLRIHLPMQGTQVWSLVWEDPTCCRAPKPMCHNYWACALEPVCHNYWACAPRAPAPQQEKPPQWEAYVPHCNEEQPPLAATRESPRAAMKTQSSQKINKFILKKSVAWFLQWLSEDLSKFSPRKATGQNCQPTILGLWELNRVIQQIEKHLFKKNY